MIDIIRFASSNRIAVRTLQHNEKKNIEKECKNML